jgi:hypothetical protein
MNDFGFYVAIVIVAVGAVILLIPLLRKKPPAGD